MQRPASAFLSAKALWGLVATGPCLTLVTGPLEGVASLSHTLQCLVAQSVTVLGTGAAVHGLVSFGTPRAVGRAGRAGVMAGAFIIVVASMLVVVPRLGAFGLRIPSQLSVFVVDGAVAIAAAYLLAARALTVLADRARVSRAEALKQRVLALQSQVNPHFLFNTLNAIAALIQLEPDVAEAMVERLSGVLQYAITAGSKSSVPFKEELDVLADYLTIEQARFGPKLRTRIEVRPELYDQRLPPMLLQPLVENAVLHGLAPRENGGEVSIVARLDGPAVVLTVADDGVGYGASKRQGNRVGLSSVRERLSLAFGGSGALEVRPRPGGGCECELRLPREAAP